MVLWRAFGVDLGRRFVTKCVPLSSSPTSPSVSVGSTSNSKGAKRGKAWCPVLTRGRLISALLFFVLFTVVLLLQCLHPGLLSKELCCSSGPVMTHVARTVTTSQQRPDNHYTDYDDYDDDLEGAQSIRYKHTKRRLPHCLIIGIRKGGTRALLEFINLHPSIQAEKREMHFFDEDENYMLGLDWYRKKMPYSFSDQITVEKTPSYFVEDLVPERVHKMNSSIRLLLILRDPVERAISDYMQIHSTRTERGKYHEPFEDMAIDPDTGDVNKSYKAIRRSIYHRHMEKWLRWFSLDQFHFISGENIVKNPVGELSMVEDFLGLDHKLTKDRFYFNHTRGFYCMHLERREKCLAPSKGRQHLPINQDVIYKLREFFRPHNQIFYDMVGINFGWP